ncbi:hypothetical protein [Acinetobacter baumannii]|uniref:hypothetical protein n=1 Tax=Acinetobacter baumannii TaxID=470 RepID=UPI0023417816|nr:hypothetical protein [Acinetobacter baumannii]MDC4013822.1 hypothetical protein [Acinetobacter baumannii]MDC4016619.1 hypothetical protein [Acinetobacter baumannii]MDC4035975.1 hypothetical protein [Acinetobacter baumannii]MDC4039652.1 hypothetical protein [Acinetobacter baumannii]MDC4051972.1 hypothetical protein [Acinetobacter baumannii]
MKPEQFIREQGLDAIKDCIEEAEAYGGLYVNAKTLELSKHIPSYDAVSITDLKRLVESVDLVESWGGIDDVKLYDLSHCKNRPESAGYKLLQAIKDHESIYGEE